MSMAATTARIRALVRGFPLVLTVLLAAGPERAIAQAAPEQEGNSSDAAAAPSGQEAGKPTQPAARSANEKQRKKKDEKSPDETKLDVITVTGTRLHTAAGEQVLPVRSYSHEDIERSGQTSIVGFLNTLPSVSTSNTAFTNTVVANQGTDGSLTPGQTVSLHGLFYGGNTLVLVDGKRMDGDFFNNFDLGRLPMSMIDRIEVMPVGVSAIYGSDALGGAINIITRKNFQGGEVGGGYTYMADSSEADARLTWGQHWDRGSLMISGSYHDEADLMASTRPFARITEQPGYGRDFLFLVTDNCSPGTVYSLDGSNLPGVGAPVAGMPTGVGSSETPALSRFRRAAERPIFATASPMACNGDQVSRVMA